MLQMILVAIAVLVALSYIFASVAADPEKQSETAQETTPADVSSSTPHAA